MAKEKVKLSPFIDVLYRKSLGRLPKANTTHWKIQLSCKIQSSYCSVVKSCPTLCDPVDCSTPAFFVLYYLLEFAQIHVHWFYDAIQPSHPLQPPSPLLTSQRHPENLPEVTGTSRGNPGILAKTRERSWESFNASRGLIPLPWLESNDALPLATRIET